LAWLYVHYCKLNPLTLRVIAMKRITLTDIAMKRITFTAAVAAALLFALAAGVESVPTNSPRGYVFGHYGSLPPVW
jgi:hypothetical protein